MATDLYEVPQAHVPVLERATYIPSWTPVFPDLTRHVCDQEGGDLGFSIGEVLPERRWAIEPSGRLLPEEQYEQLYKRWISLVLTPSGTLVRLSSQNKYFDANLESIPPADVFVDAKPDALMPEDATRTVPIRYRFGLGGKGRAKIRPVYTHTGEKAETASEESLAMPPGFDAVKPSAEQKEKVEPIVILETMPCGKQQNARYKANHMRFCKACKRAEAEKVA